MDLDLALREDCPTSLTDKSTSDDKREKKRWEKSNRMCMMIMKKVIPKAFRGTMSEKINTTKDFLADIEKRLVKNEKAEVCTLLTNLLLMRHKGKGNIKEYILEMSYLASRLKALKLDIYDDFLVCLVLISLPSQFSQFKMSYNHQKETWSLNELISHCVQEEKKLKAEGHKKKQCTNYHAWRAKRSMLLNLVCSEVNLSSVPRHTWWIDYGATTHISVSMQGCLSCRKPNDVERYIYVGDGKTV
ncbi:hypothetical protein OWV82_003478 [Melia azedarach]|uniref:Uncharacterized protein n=1 Tax=Melia azedarach TaxID=155640 RepID=A0ACC1YL16_MELAZ|nr:hypothetical protein OWV82_003478 [Melia azedarach]